MGISKAMQNYCGDAKSDDLLNSGLKILINYEKDVVPATFAYNPHELMRLLEVFDILTVSQIIIYASLARKSSSKVLCFNRIDNELEETENDKRLITLRLAENKVVLDEKPLDFYGDLKENYEKYNRDYSGGKQNV